MDSQVRARKTRPGAAGDQPCEAARPGEAMLGAFWSWGAGVQGGVVP